MIVYIDQAISSLRPGSSFRILGEQIYSNLEWLDENTTPPTEEEVNIELERLQKDYDNTQYQRDRALAYPSFADQFDLLYHGGYDAWKAEIDKIKNKYPKVNNAN